MTYHFYVNVSWEYLVAFAIMMVNYYYYLLLLFMGKDYYLFIIIIIVYSLITWRKNPLLV